MYTTIREWHSHVNGDDVMYHGTSNFGFDDFNMHEVNYFTKDKNYAMKYTDTAYSALRSGKKSGVKGIYTVRLKCDKVFDTMNSKEDRKIFLDYTNNHGNQTPLAQSGYPDWSDVENLAQYFEDMGYDYDCIIMQDAFGFVTYATIGPDKVEIVDKQTI